MDRKPRRLILLAALVFAAALICSAFFMAFSAVHSCRHENCQICAIVSVCQSVLKALSGITALQLWCPMALCLGLVCCYATVPLPHLPTPVSSKVKLSN